ncbi:hypothetical protein [Mesonia maritima]|uniref:Gliding motility protein RemB n=1 Tax=Mesonia maritima TaxID=1793873 RepID=A0ABU1K965_9FLAO|nr:hypothetical protein [Mesonia maritima]MDR6301851.1 hypothetical protein [Mesonia maritima]
MKTKIILAFAVFAFTFNLKAQNLGTFKPAENIYGKREFKKFQKRAYIANFSVNFEFYKEAVDKKAKGGFGRSIKNAAKAEAAIGLSTLSREMIQEKTNALYQELVTKLQQGGYEIITPEEAGKTEIYEGWEKYTGPQLSETNMTGVLKAIPENFSFYYNPKKIDFLNQINQKLSKEMNDALVVNVELNFMFSETGDNWLRGNGAQVKLFVNYRLVDNYTVTDKKTNSGITSLFDKSKQAKGLSSYINFTQGKNKIGGSALASYDGGLKQSLEIEGVLEKEKVVAYSAQTQATATLQNPVVVIRGDNYASKTKWLEPDPKKYAEGLYMAGHQFLDYHISEFLDQTN